jgi:hypothetical protein
MLYANDIFHVHTVTGIVAISELWDSGEAGGTAGTAVTTESPTDVQLHGCVFKAPVIIKQEEDPVEAMEEYGRV